MSSSPTSLDVVDKLRSLNMADAPPTAQKSDPGTVISNDRKPDRAAVLRAAESPNRHPRQPTRTTTRISTAYEYEDFGGNHKLRAEFRRLINPGIMRNNSRAVSLEALRLLTKIAEDMLKHPGNDNYPKVKQTGNKMKKFIMEAKGTVEVLVALGFRTEVVEMEELYCFNVKYLETLRIGAHCLKEALNNEVNKEEAAEREKRQQAANEKAAKTKVEENVVEAFRELIVQQVINAFYDDRRRNKYAAEAAESRRDDKGQ